MAEAVLLITGTRGRQLAGRCGLITTGAFPFCDESLAIVRPLSDTTTTLGGRYVSLTDAARAELIAALEAILRLHRHPARPRQVPATAHKRHDRQAAHPARAWRPVSAGPGRMVW